jgi:DNA-binding IclR family transcriptional regulator
VLASLCEEGVAERGAGGVYRLAPAFRDAVAGAGSETEPDLHDLSGVVEDLLARTHKRSYLAVVRGGRLRIVAERGLQGMPRLPGMSAEIGDNAHALALGKVALALARPETVDAYVAHGLRPFTPNTITAPDELRAELRAVRRAGVATEREEFDGDFCCIAAPVLDERRHFLGAVGISMSRRAFEEERDALQETLRDVVRFQACADSRNLLDPVHDPRLASASGSPLR